VKYKKTLDCLDLYCKKWKLDVNMEKTKLMVFRNGGKIKRNEAVYYRGTKIDCVPYYKYLGVTISTRLSWTPAQVNLSDQARKALKIVDRVNYNLDYPFSSGCKIFDTCVLPILTYCSEVWGNDVHKVIEDVHVKFCRNQLGVGKREMLSSSERRMWETQNRSYLYYEMYTILDKDFTNARGMFGKGMC